MWWRQRSCLVSLLIRALIPSMGLYSHIFITFQRPPIFTLRVRASSGILDVHVQSLANSSVVYIQNA